MNKQEILDKWDKLGFSSVEEYHNSFTSKFTELGLEYFESLFDPDQISSRDFWEAGDERFGLDGVCNSARYNSEGKLLALDVLDNITRANINNHRLAVGIGLLGFLDISMYNHELRKLSTCIAEIGAGWGSFNENFVKHNNVALYQGFDLIARVDGVEEVDPMGYFTDEQVEKYKNKFNTFYCSNVFQHLSKKQISTYFSQVSEMLPKGGHFILGLTQQRSFHYGQLLPVYSRQEYLDLFAKNKFGLCAESHLYTSSLAPWGVFLEKL